MEFSKVRVIEYSDGTTYVYPFSADEIKSKSNVLVKMIQRIMEHRGIDDPSNSYPENTIQLLKSMVYTNVSFSDGPVGSKRCGGDDNIGRNCSNCSSCVLFQTVI